MTKEEKRVENKRLKAIALEEVRRKMWFRHLTEDEANGLDAYIVGISDNELHGNSLKRYNQIMFAATAFMRGIECARHKHFLNEWLEETRKMVEDVETGCVTQEVEND